MNAIQVNGLTKRYKNFQLDDVSFTVPSGYICGFIGQNGAGKTTTLKLLLDMAKPESGTVEILGHSVKDNAVKERVGVLFEQPYYQEVWTPTYIEKALRSFYPRWDSTAYHGYLQRFELSPKQKFKTLSRGMKMKLGMAVSLSLGVDLLLLDEPTGGLDPVMRDQMLDLLRLHVSDETKSIFFSTHITSDLEKIADYIVYIHQGRIIYSGTKDDLLEKYCVLRGGLEELPQIKNIIGLRKHIGGFDGMIEITNIGGLPSGVITEAATLDDIMVYTGRESQV